MARAARRAPHYSVRYSHTSLLARVLVALPGEITYLLTIEMPAVPHRAAPWAAAASARAAVPPSAEHHLSSVAPERSLASIMAAQSQHTSQSMSDEALARVLQAAEGTPPELELDTTTAPPPPDGDSDLAFALRLQEEEAMADALRRGGRGLVGSWPRPARRLYGADDALDGTAAGSMAPPGSGGRVAMDDRVPALLHDLREATSLQSELVERELLGSLMGGGRRGGVALLEELVPAGGGSDSHHHALAGGSAGGPAAPGDALISKHNAFLSGRRNARAMERLMGTAAGNLTSTGVLISQPAAASLQRHVAKQRRKGAAAHGRVEAAAHSTAEGVLDARTRLILHRLIDCGRLEGVAGVIATGKEAAVYMGMGWDPVAHWEAAAEEGRGTAAAAVAAVASRAGGGSGSSSSGVVDAAGSSSAAALSDVVEVEVEDGEDEDNEDDDVDDDDTDDDNGEEGSGSDDEFGEGEEGTGSTAAVEEVKPSSSPPTAAAATSPATTSAPAPAPTTGVQLRVVGAAAASAHPHGGRHRSRRGDGGAHPQRLPSAAPPQRPPPLPPDPKA